LIAARIFTQKGRRIKPFETRRMSSTIDLIRWKIFNLTTK